MIEGACHCGAVTWRFDRVPESATACNCTMCRRLGGLWAYDWQNEAVRVAGETAVHVRQDEPQPTLGNHFCPRCGCVAYSQALSADKDGRRRVAVNLRLALDPAQIAAIPIRHFDGLDTWSETRRDGRTVADYWF